jgi:hypothetical protein
MLHSSLPPRSDAVFDRSNVIFETNSGLPKFESDPLEADRRPKSRRKGFEIIGEVDFRHSNFTSIFLSKKFSEKRNDSRSSFGLET